MIKISVELKAVIVQKALSRGSATLESIARANNIGISTLSRWITQFRSGELQVKDGAVKLGYATAADRLQHLLNTASLDDAALGSYCREHGLYSHQLTQWKDAMSTDHNDKNKLQSEELKVLRAENKSLKKELNRKEKALAETAALLVLKKKLHSIWGEHEDD